MRRKGKRIQSATQLGYNERHAKSGIAAPLPDIETFSNQYKGYEITIEIPEYTAICPKTGLPDFGTITLHYMPDKQCLELKSLKMYIHAYRNVGIFYENSVYRILQDIVKACRPVGESHRYIRSTGRAQNCDRRTISVKHSLAPFRFS